VAPVVANKKVQAPLKSLVYLFFVMVPGMKKTAATPHLPSATLVVEPDHVVKKSDYFPLFYQFSHKLREQFGQIFLLT
jgi:hypothetical protein